MSNTDQTRALIMSNTDQTRFKRPLSPDATRRNHIKCLDPDRSAIVQAYRMSSAEFDIIKDSMARRRLDSDISLRLLPETGWLAPFEVVTYAPWWLHLVTWVPLCLWVYIWKLPHTLGVALLITFGMLGMWPLLEYLLHRFIFHSSVAWASVLPRPLQGCVNVTRLLLHSVHHAHPTDRKRIITPLPMSLAIAGLVLPPYILLFHDPKVAYSICVGIVLGFVKYDYVHYDHHLGVNLDQWPRWIPSRIKEHFRVLRRAHKNHHYAVNGHESSFGVSESFCDDAFGTTSKLVAVE